MDQGLQHLHLRLQQPSQGILHLLFLIPLVMVSAALQVAVLIR